jgi:hypothetical protein
VWVVVHLYVGLAIGVAVPLPLWALILLAIGSHVLLDLVPHWDYTRTSHVILWGSLDFLAGLVTLAIAWSVFGASWEVLLLGIVAAAPDFDVVFAAARGGGGDHWFPSHRKGFPHGKCGPALGITTQAIVVAASCLVMAFV